MKNFQIKAAFAAFLCAFSFAFTSCDHDDEEVKPGDNSITITAPTEGAIVNPGQSVAITGTITGKEEIHGYKLYVRQKADGKVLFSKEVHDHKKEIAINETWAVDTVAKYKELELEVVATLDHDGNTLSKKVNLYALPAGVHNVATIIVNTPTENAVVLKNTTLNISGSINSIAVIHGYTIKVHLQGDTATLFKKEAHIHEKLVNFNETWTVPAVTVANNYELEVSAKLDHDGNVETKKVKFQVKP